MSTSLTQPVTSFERPSPTCVTPELFAALFPVNNNTSSKSIPKPVVTTASDEKKVATATPTHTSALFPVHPQKGVHSAKVEEIDKIAAALKDVGVIVLEDAYDPTFATQLEVEYLKYYERLQAALRTAGLTEPPFIFSNLAARVPGRLEHLFDIFSKADGIPNPPIFGESSLVDSRMRRLLERLLETPEIHFDIGGVPSAAKSSPGRWHRDVYGLFGDEYDFKIPPWYITILIPFKDVNAEQGVTSMVLGSHKIPKADVTVDTNYITQHALLKQGQALIFDGRIIHRGEPNTTDESRHFIYMEATKAWYLEKERYLPRFYA